MSTVTVKNPKSFALTKSKKYEVLAEENNRVRIVNDNNIQAFYSLKLFKDPKPVVPILEEVKNSIVFDYNGGNNPQLTLTILGEAYSIPAELSMGESPISCGIATIKHINRFMTRKLAFIEALNINGIDLPFKQNVVKAMFETAILGTMDAKAATYSMFLLSTNTNFDNFAMIDDILGAMIVADYTTMNPNSENEIKLWVLTQQ